MPDDITPIDEAVMWLLGAFLALCCIHASYLLSEVIARRDQAPSHQEMQQCNTDRATHREAV